MWSGLFGVKSVNAAGFCIKRACAGNASIRDYLSCASNAYTGNAFITDTYIRGFYARNTNDKSISIKSIYAGDTCVRDAAAIKYLGIHL